MLMAGAICVGPMQDDQSAALHAQRCSSSSQDLCRSPTGESRGPKTKSAPYAGADAFHQSGEFRQKRRRRKS